MNTFGSATKQFQLCDPKSVVGNRARFRRDAVPTLDRANSLYVPTGRLPARGWVLLPHYEYDQLDTYITSLQLSVGDPSLPDNVGVIKNLSVVQAQCVTTGLSSDPNALYLVELTDARGVLHNKWVSFPTNNQYNIRVPAYPQTFHPASMNSGTTWTWSAMLQDLWQQVPLLGAWPGLPFAPAGTPEGFWFTGVPLWTSLCGVLDYLGLTVACDLTKSNPYTIVSMGADDAAFDALQSRYAMPASRGGCLEDDQEWVDGGSARVPGSVVVYFRRRNAVYGTEEVVRRDSTQWDMTSTHSVTIASPAMFVASAGMHHTWSDFTIRYDQDGAPLPADVATAQVIAAERVSQYFDRVFSRTSGYMTQTYAGALPFATGSQVDGVCWYQDYSSQRRQGWKTKIARGDPPFAGVWE